MTFYSILFDSTAKEKRAEALEEPTFFTDLNLGQLVDAIAARRKGYNLKPFYYTPLRDAATIRYRHQVMRDVEDDRLRAQIKAFVPAGSFSANLCDGLYTHFMREEDTTMESGKLDEELGRMSDIVGYLAPNAMVLFNESFAATNEREGSEIARQIVTALLEGDVKVFFVTHLYELARGFYGKRMENAMFLRAERQTDGTRTFKLLEAPPLQTSYGQDLYHEIFGDAVRMPDAGTDGM